MKQAAPYMLWNEAVDFTGCGRKASAQGRKLNTHAPSSERASGSDGADGKTTKRKKPL